MTIVVIVVVQNNTPAPNRTAHTQQNRTPPARTDLQVVEETPQGIPQNLLVGTLVGDGRRMVNIGGSDPKYGQKYVLLKCMGG